MQIQGVRTPSECVRIKEKGARVYNCEQMMIIYTEIRSDMNKVIKQ